MCDQTQRVFRNRGQLLFNERTEETAQLDVRQHRVARLLEAEDALRANVLSRESRRLPVALLDAPGVDQEDALDAHRGRASDDTIHNLRTWQCENERDRNGRRWI